jgi:hypothetical protein
MMLVADGWPHVRIAATLGIARATLARHFAWELEHGGDRKRLELLEAADRAAGKGNVSAIKWLMKRYDAAYAAEVAAAARPKAQDGVVLSFPIREAR